MSFKYTGSLKGLDTGIDNLISQPVDGVINPEFEIKDVITRMMQDSAAVNATRMDASDPISKTASVGSIPTFGTRKTTHSHTSGESHSGIAVGGLTIASVLDDPSSPYYFRGSMSEEVLHRYLGRVLQVANLSHRWQTDNHEGPEYSSAYDPWTNKDALFLPGHQHRQLLDMIIDTGAKFVFDMATYRDDWQPDYFDWVCQTFQNDADYLHGKDPEIICSYSVQESWSKNGAKVLLPKREIVDMIYSHFGQIRSTDPGIINQKYFDDKYLQNDWYSTANYDWPDTSHADYTKPEGMLWYYYVSTTFIARGAESIHFGDIFYIADFDSGNRHLWFLVNKIRDYARTSARRGNVLIDTHTRNNPALRNALAWYVRFDKTPDDPLWKRPLIFDFNSLGAYYKRNLAKKPMCHDEAWDPISHPGWGDSTLPVILEFGYGLLDHNLGGLHPQGWNCAHIPNLTRFDSGGNANGSGCKYKYDTDPLLPDTYGFDNTSWYARQKIDQKEAILKYSHFKIRCVDPYSHFGMPGRLIIRKSSKSPQNTEFYNAFEEKDTIRDVWSGIPATPLDWMPHSFSFENLAVDDIVKPRAHLVLVGEDKMFFIGTDSYIHGYYRHNGTYNGGNWLTCSPSYAAHGYHGAADSNQLLSSQVKAKNSLVANPDGTKLFYIGEDNNIHGFNIISGWDFTYFTFMKSELLSAELVAESNLIFPENDRMYFIGSGNAFREWHRIYGLIFLSGSWHIVKPAAIAEMVHSLDMDLQPKAEGALAYVPGAFPKLFYRDFSGLVAYYEMHSLYDYIWKNCPANSDLNLQNLRVISNFATHSTSLETRLYFVARWIPDGSRYVHCIINHGTAWTMVSPSYNAYYTGTPVSLQLQSSLNANIAVSPDGSTIFYIPESSNYICYFKNIDGTYFDYKMVKVPIDEKHDAIGQGNNLRFKNNAELFFISSLRKDVQRFVFEECYCLNPSISSYE